MKDNEIIKALECCGKPVNEECCSECPYHLGGEENCHKLIGDTIDLINRQQAQKEALIAGQEKMSKYIEEQQAEIARLQKLLDDKCDRCIARNKTEAVKEFAEIVKVNKNRLFNLIYSERGFDEQIDNLAKMVGEQNG